MSRATLSMVLLLSAALAAPLEAAPIAAGDPTGSDPGSPGTGLIDPDKVLDFGFGLQLDRPYHAPGDQVRATLFFFNMTPMDADGSYVNFGGFGCRYHVFIRDPKGRTVWRPQVPCPLMPGGGAAPLGPFPFPGGTFLQLPADLSLVYLGSETLDPDGKPLPGGAYTMEARHDYNGPVLPEPEFWGGGGEPYAEVPFRIVECDGAGGGLLPMRELGRGQISGYRFMEPDFYGEDLVLRSEEAALEFWRQHTSNLQPPPDPPHVDFHTEMVLVSVMGTQSTGGPTIEILDAEEFSCRIDVRVRYDPTPGQLPVVTNPYHAVTVPRSLKEVRFLRGMVNGPQK